MCSSLQGTASTLRPCEHTFCEECMEDIAGQTERLDHLIIVKCPFFSSDQMLSPRPLPRMVGYRILSRREWGPRYGSGQNASIPGEPAFQYTHCTSFRLHRWHQHWRITCPCVDVIRPATDSLSSRNRISGIDYQRISVDIVDQPKVLELICYYLRERQDTEGKARTTNVWFAGDSGYKISDRCPRSVLTLTSQSLVLVNLNDL